MYHKYLRKRKNKNGDTNYYYYPPQKYIDAGVARREIFDNYRRARDFAIKYNKLIEKYKKGEIPGYRVWPTSTLNQVRASYLRAPNFNFLSAGTRRQYEHGTKKVCDTELPATTFGNIKLNKITSSMCNEVYQSWLKYGTSQAEFLVRMFSILMTYAMANDAIERNPMAVVPKVQHKPQTVEWTKDQVTKFLETSFTKFEWRPIGLLVACAYEWCQRPVDIRYLKWEDIDWEKEEAHIKQKKRGATVHLPISENLMTMLRQQKEELDFQPWVIPYLAIDKQWKPMSSSKMYQLMGEVLEEAGLPDNLKAGSLRKTGILEMRDGGADAVTMMSVTGHRSLSSLNPYMKNRIESARKALEYRK